MNRSLGRRVVLVGLLVTTLFGLCVWFGTLGPAPALGSYPSADEFGPTPEPFIGHPVTTGGIVTTTDPVQIDVEYGVDQHRTLTITAVETPVEEGDTLRVFGTLVDQDTIAATNAFAVPASGFLYTYLVSFVAGLWVLCRVITQWRFDPQQGLVRRSSPLRSLTQLRAWGRDGGTDDA